MQRPFHLFTDGPEWAEEPVSGRVAYGERLRLTCSAEGQPAPSLTWWRDGAAILNTQDRFRSIHAGSALQGKSHLCIPFLGIPRP